jgi:hypothetical protein
MGIKKILFYGKMISGPLEKKRDESLAFLIADRRTRRGRSGHLRISIANEVIDAVFESIF